MENYVYLGALLVVLILGSVLQLLREFRRAEGEPSLWATFIGSGSFMALLVLFKYVAYRQRHPDAAFWTFFF